MAVAFRISSGANTNSSTASTTVSFTAPNFSTGDVWICDAAFRMGSGGTISGVPAGFTLIKRTDSGSASTNVTLVSYSYVPTGSETPLSVFATITLSASSKYVAITTALSGVNTTTPIVAGSAVGAGGATSPQTTTALAALATGQAAFGVAGQQGTSSNFPTLTNTNSDQTLNTSHTGTSGGSSATNVGLVEGYCLAATDSASQAWSAALATTTLAGHAFIIDVASSGTTNPVTVSATCATTATTGRAVGKTLAATAASAATLVRQVPRSVAATATTAATAIRQIPRSAAATVATATSVVASKAKNITVSCTTTTSAVVTRAVSKSVTATASTSSTVARQVGRTVKATAASAVGVGRQVSKTVTATAATGVTVVRQVGRTVLTSAATSAVVAAVKNAGNVTFNVTVAAAVTTTATVRRAIARTVGASTATVVTVGRVRAVSLRATTATAATVVKAATRRITVSATVTTTAKIIRRIGKTLSAAVSSAVSLIFTPTISSKRFTPPTRYYTPSILPSTPNSARSPARYFSHTNIPQPVNVYKMNDGTYTEQQTAGDFWQNVAIAYYGGRTYTVTDTEAAALTAAGYSANLA